MNNNLRIVKIYAIPTQMEKLVSVIVCTYNRAKYLEKCLESLHQQTYKNYEIIIVNGPSTDETSKVIEKFPNLKIINQEQLNGLSNARNLGIKAAMGDTIGFIDDDAIADNNWLKNIIDTFLNFPENVDAVGGKINPIWERPKPGWLSDELLSGLSILDIHESTHVLPQNQFLFGTNMAFKKSILIEFNGFNQNLGRKGKILLSNEEEYLQKKIIENGGRRIYNPDVVVKHHISPDRLTKSWFIHRYYWQGISDSAMYIIKNNPSLLKRIGVTFQRIFNLFLNRHVVKRLLISTNNPGEFEDKCYAYTELGYISGLLRRVS